MVVSFIDLLACVPCCCFSRVIILSAAHLSCHLLERPLRVICLANSQAHVQCNTFFREVLSLATYINCCPLGKPLTIMQVPSSCACLMLNLFSSNHHKGCMSHAAFASLVVNSQLSTPLTHMHMSCAASFSEQSSTWLPILTVISLADHS